MPLPFLDRGPERRRLRRAFAAPRASFSVLYGRRRCGKSRLLLESMPARRTVYYVADMRESILQRADVASQIARLLPGFDQVVYPDWSALLARWWATAPPGAVLALDEFPLLASAAPELPSVLQKFLDRRDRKPLHLVLCGSSQRMMQGLVLDRTASLYGRAGEILKLPPLPPGWIGEAVGDANAVGAVESYALWGGIPRYWELARPFRRRWDAVRDLVFDPAGVLHQEPERLLLDELHEIGQSASLLTLIGQGCHRLSELAGRLGKPATSLTRPLQRLMELDLIRREHPFGAEARTGKRTLYRIADPFLRFWFRFIEPNRSRLAAGQFATVTTEVQAAFPAYVAGVWAELARASVSRTKLFGREWGPAARWWGGGHDHVPLELDLVAESVSRDALLVGEVKWSDRTSTAAAFRELQRKVAAFPLADGRAIYPALWLKTAGPIHRSGAGAVYGPATVMAALR